MKQAVLLLGLSVLLVGCYHQGPLGTQAPVTEPETIDEEAGDDLIDEAEVVEEVGVGVEISNFAFAPKTLTVGPGETVSVTNRDSVGHTMTSDDGEAFDSGVIEQNENVTFTAPLEPGEYPYHCTPHPNMKATLVVAE